MFSHGIKLKLFFEHEQAAVGKTNRWQTIIQQQRSCVIGPLSNQFVDLLGQCSNGIGNHLCRDVKLLFLANGFDGAELVLLILKQGDGRGNQLDQHIVLLKLWGMLLP